MQFLRQNTAVIVTVGPFYGTDGLTIKTALTITNEKITLTADTDDGAAPTNILDNVTGATSGTSNDLNYIAGNDAGMMQLELSAANVNRVGRMKLSITDAANHAPVFKDFFVLPQAIYDWFIGTIIPLPANVTQWLGTAVSTPTVAGVPNVNVKTWNDLAAVALPLVPTTAGRTLDVSATGEAGIDWANIGSPTTAQGLTGTTIAITQKVDVETIKTNPVVNAGTVTFPSGATLASTTNITAGTITTVTNLTNAPTVGDLTETMKTSVTTAATAATPVAASVTGNVGGNVVGSVGSVVGLTPANLDVAVSSRMATYVQPTGFLAATFPAMLASPTNITAGTITTVTNLTNAPTVGDFTDTMKASVTTAASAATPTVASVSGSVGSVVGSVGSVVGLNVANLDATVSSRATPALFTSVRPESYSALGTEATIDQLLYEIRSLLQEKERTSDLITTKKIDGATVAMTFRLNSASHPSSITRES